MSLQFIWTVATKKLKGNLVARGSNALLGAVLLLGCGGTPTDLPQIKRSAIGLTATFPNGVIDHSQAQVLLTFSNHGDHAGTIVLPSPLKENATSFGSPENPILVLIAEELLTSSEAGFTLTDFSNRAGDRGKTLTLKPGESAEVPFPLASFCSWGHAGPVQTKRFLDCLRPGEHEVAVRAIVAYSEVEPEKADRIESSPVVLKCAFSDGLFRKKP